jgi:hypothetical protein
VQGGANPNLERLHRAGVSVWLDTLSRELLGALIEAPGPTAA